MFFFKPPLRLAKVYAFSCQHALTTEVGEDRKSNEKLYILTWLSYRRRIASSCSHGQYARHDICILFATNCLTEQSGRCTTCGKHSSRYY